MSGKKYIEQLGLRQDQMLEMKQIVKVLPMIQRDTERKIQALFKVLVDKGVLTEDEFEVALDEVRGLKYKTDEPIEAGDVVFVNYQTTVEGQEDRILKQSNVPVRVGSNTTVFEPALIGKLPGATGITFEHIFKDRAHQQFFGKRVSFVIDVVKVKTHIKPEGLKNVRGENGRTNIGEPTGPGPTGNEVTNFEPGPGNESKSDTEAQPGDRGLGQPECSKDEGGVVQ